MFSDAISSISWRWRPSSPRIAAAISGSACSSPAVKNESGAEVVLALLAEEFIGEISPPPQPVTGIAAGHVWRSKAALAGYHIGGLRPSSCGRSLINMQDMVGMGVEPPRSGRQWWSSPRPACGERSLFLVPPPLVGRVGQSEAEAGVGA